MGQPTNQPQIDRKERGRERKMGQPLDPSLREIERKEEEREKWDSF